MRRRYLDRADAGRRLGDRLAARGPFEDGLVLGLARGGVLVAAEVATRLGAPLDVLVVRKLGAPGRPELAIGAVAGGVQVLNDRLVRNLGVTQEEIDEVARRELAELARRERTYRGGGSPVRIAGRRVLLVDDGLATGASMRAAVEAVRAGGADRIVVAVPVGAQDACTGLKQTADEVVCLHAPPAFEAVGAYYTDFRQTTDAEVCAALDRAVGG